MQDMKKRKLLKLQSLIVGIKIAMIKYEITKKEVVK